MLCRPADSETVDDAAVRIGIPSGTCSESEACDGVNIYVVFLKPAGYNHQQRSHVPIKGLRLGHLLGAGKPSTSWSACCPSLLGWIQFPHAHEDMRSLCNKSGRLCWKGPMA